MKNKFPAYYRPSSNEKIELFNAKDCYFVFDTNALLDLYRLGKDTTDKVLSLIDKYKSRIIIPYHVAEEYHNDLLGVITKRIASYNNTLSVDNEEIIQSLCDSLKLNELPTIKEKFKSSIGDSIKRFIKGVKKERDYLKEQFQSWDLQHKISNSLGNNILEGFSEDEIRSIENEGEKRYSDEVPPGYRDVGKKSNKYGDLIIWKEILRFAGSKNCSIIFISRDLKEDWILRCNGMDCGPRQELLNEFKNVSTGSFVIYTLDRFLEYANKEQNVLNDRDLEDAIRILSTLATTLNAQHLKGVSIEEVTPKDNAKYSTDVSSPKNYEIIMAHEVIPSKAKDSVVDD